MIFYRKLAIRLCLALLIVILLEACATGPAAPPPAGGLPSPLPVNPVPTGTAQPQPTLPPPLIITIPADRLDIAINDSAAAAGAITTQGDVNGGIIQFEDGLPAEVEELLARIYEGDYPIDTTGQNPGALPATFTYSDMNGDGVEDLVIILVVEPGDYSNITAGSTQGNPVIQIFTRPEAGTVAEGLSIPVDELLAMTGNGESEMIGDGAYLITLAPEELSRWAEPLSAE